jgi:Icc-related predicted phosphoesterase
MIKLCAISDTHGLHDFCKVGQGDILVYAGDCTMDGLAMEVIYFLDWFEKQDYTHKIWIPGNHEFVLDAKHNRVESSLDRKLYERIKPMYNNEGSIHYLRDTGVTIEGYTFWGSPYTPAYGSWAFMYPRGQGKPYWDKIPDATDILITHGPPVCALGVNKERIQVGCTDLSRAIERVQPRYHICGHIHEGRGVQTIYHGEPSNKMTTIVNASFLTAKYEANKDNPVTIIELGEKNITFET